MGVVPCGEEGSEREGEGAAGAAAARSRLTQGSSAASPKLANDPGFAAAVGGTPPDPQIAVSSTHVLVGLVDRVAFYTKSGSPYPSSSNTVIATALFQSIITGSNLSPNAQGHIDSFSDLRAIFDPYRKRFWLATTGAYRACVKVSGKCQKGFSTLPNNQKRTIVAVAVSVDEDPTHGWNLYWWDAAVGWGTTDAPYHAGDMGDYPSLGVNAVTVDVSVAVADPSRSYSHIALYNANDMAAGKGPTIDGWWLYPLFKDNTTCNGGFRNPDGSCPGAIIQPTLAHPDPGGAFLVGRHGSKGLVIWKVTDLLQPTQLVQAVEVQMPTAFNNPGNAPQKGAPAANTIAMSNLNTDVLKSVWRKFLYVVANDADASGRAQVRVLRLWVSGFPNVPAPPDGGSKQFLIGTGSTSWYSWPAIEVNKNYDAVVIYARAGPQAWAAARYNAWLDGEVSLRTGRVMKEGQAAIPKATRWGDLAGASVDFVNGKEAEGIWITHEYAKQNGTYGMWVGKVFGQSYLDWYFADAVLAGVPRKLDPGSSFELHATLRNGGDKTAPKTELRAFLVSATGDRTGIGSTDAPALRPGRSTALDLAGRLPMSTPAGLYRVTLVVDSENKSAEYSETNNKLNADGTVEVARPPAPPEPPPTTTPTTTPPPPPPPPSPPASPPDLVISKLTTASVTVKNVGDTAAGDFEVTVSSVGAFTIGGLPSGATETRTFASPCSRTVRSITARADARNQVAESDEMNNSTTISC